MLRRKTGRYFFPRPRERMFLQPTNIPNQGELRGLQFSTFRADKQYTFRASAMLRQAMFPTPPEAPPAPPIPPGPTLEWPIVTDSEIATAINTSAPNKAPGPDGMPFLLLQLRRHTRQLPCFSTHSTLPSSSMDTIPSVGDRQPVPF